MPLTKDMLKELIDPRTAFRKTITFDGTSGNGAVGTVRIAGVRGRILLSRVGVYCNTTLVGVGAKIQFGHTSNTDGICPLTTASDIAAGSFWQDATPEVGTSPGIVDQLVADGDLLLTISVAAITAGQLEFFIDWQPHSDKSLLLEATYR